MVLVHGQELTSNPKKIWNPITSSMDQENWNYNKFLEAHKIIFQEKFNEFVFTSAMGENDVLLTVITSNLTIGIPRRA